MEPKLLELHFSQLQFEWSKSKYNSYSDRRTREYHSNLAKIISGLEKEDFQKLNKSDIDERNYIILFLLKSLEFLNNSTTSRNAFETIYVLSDALNDWIIKNDYIIVTSLVKDLNGFSFDNYLTFNDYIYFIIENLYSVKFNNKLIQINLPESTSKDYLSNVVLYHEIGHFIDSKYEITRILYVELLELLLKDSLEEDDRTSLVKYFPYLVNHENIVLLKNKYDSNNILANHIAEYFCDLFASQYIDNCSNLYLKYITCNQSHHNNTHPSTTNRIDFVNHFLNKEKAFIIDFFANTIKKTTTFEIKQRNKVVLSDNFESLIPIDIKHKGELHGLFVYGWKVWMDNWINIKSKSNMKFDLTQVQVYEIINNLIEKSIGNYIVKTEWEIVKKSQNDTY